MNKKGKIVIGIFILVFAYITCFSYSEECTNIFNQSSSIIQSLSSEEYKKKIYDEDNRIKIKTMTNEFCNQVKALQCEDKTEGNSLLNDYFDASQSVFLTILCNSANDKRYIPEEGPYFMDTENLLKKKTFYDFNIVSSLTGYQEYCHSNKEMVNCKYSYYLPDIFNQIMNDMFDIAQARYFGVSSISEFSAEESAKSFSIENIPGIKLGICDQNNEYYKTTCKKLKGYMKSAKNMLEKTKIIKILELEKNAEKGCGDKFKDNILYCGLLGDSSSYGFINTIYNEYFWYSLFMGYYSINLNNSLTYKNVQLSDDVIEDRTEIINIIEEQLSKTKTAMSQSLRDLTELKSSFPLHIGLLMYQEDVQLFMDEFYKIYSPIRTLYDKFRNVQVQEG